MKTPFGGVLILAAVTLAGCVGPMTLPEAKQMADRQVLHYCRAHTDCGKLLQTRSQRLNDRWLIDYDSNGRIFTVAVDDSGNARLDIWNKK